MRDGADLVAGGRIDDVDRAAGGGRAPVAVDEKRNVGIHVSCPLVVGCQAVTHGTNAEDRQPTRKRCIQIPMTGRSVCRTPLPHCQGLAVGFVTPRDGRGSHDAEPGARNGKPGGWCDGGANRGGATGGDAEGEGGSFPRRRAARRLTRHPGPGRDRAQVSRYSAAAVSACGVVERARSAIRADLPLRPRR